jgi:hypothetical protein
MSLTLVESVTSGTKPNLGLVQVLLIVQQHLRGGACSVPDQRAPFTVGAFAVAHKQLPTKATALAQIAVAIIDLVVKEEAVWGKVGAHPAV